MRNGLVVPLGLAVRCVDRDDTVGIEVVARTNAAVEVG
jgi:hypothetical protein